MGFAAEGSQVNGLHVTGVADIEDFLGGRLFGGRFCGGRGSIAGLESAGSIEGIEINTSRLLLQKQGLVHRWNIVSL